MIQNDAQFHQTLEQLERMYHALAELRRDILPKNPSNFAILAEGPVEEIRRLREEVDVYSGATKAEEFAADLWLHLEGKSLHWPETPTSILTAFLDSLRKGVQAVAEYLSEGRLTARPTAEIKRACDLEVIAFGSGSLRLGLRLPIDEQRTNEELPLSMRALQDYLEVAAWVDSDHDISALEHRFDDPQRLRLLLNALKTFVPRPRGAVDRVELTGRFIPGGRPIRLSRQIHARIDQAIDRTVAAQIEEHDGDLREIDLDEYSFILRNAGDIQQIQCTFDRDLLETAKEALDRPVRVTGTRSIQPGRRQAGKLHVTRLVIIDPGTEQN